MKKVEIPKAVCEKCKYYRSVHLCGANELSINPITGDIDYALCKEINKKGDCPDFTLPEKITKGILKRIFG